VQVLKEEVRNQILKSAERQFLKNGFLDAKTRDIAKEAKISVSNLYLYYENKEMLFYAIADPIFNHFMTDLNKFLDHADRQSDLNENIGLGIGKLISGCKDEFILISEKSKGTKYESFRSTLTTELTQHIADQLRDDLNEKAILARVFANSLMVGITLLAESCENEDDLNECLQSFVNYHAEGIRQFVKN